MSAAERQVEDVAACDFCQRAPDAAGMRLAGRTVCICQHCVGAACLLQAYDLHRPGAVERAWAAGRDAAIEGCRARPSSLWRSITGALRRRKDLGP